MLRTEVDVINLSAFVPGQSGQLLSSRIKALAVGGVPLLVVPDAALRRTSYSGYGNLTVRIFAPADPIGAVDMDGLMQPDIVIGANAFPCAQESDVR